MLQNNKQTQLAALGFAALIFLFIQFGVLNTPPHILILAVMTLMLFLIAFLKINLALCILLVSMLLSPEFGLGGVRGRLVVLRFDDLFILMLFLGWLARMAVSKEIGLLRITRLNKPILCYVLICWISSAIGVLRGTTTLKHSFFYNLKYLEYFLVFFMVSNNIQNKKQIRMFLRLMLAVCLIVSVFALYVAFSEGLRATAPFEGEQGEPNTLAGYLIIMTGLAMGLFLHLKRFRTRLFLGGMIALMGVALLYTLSRSGWLGAVAMFVAFLFLSRRGKGFLLAVVLALLMAAPLIAQKMPKEITQRYSASFRGGDTFDVGGRDFTIDESASIRIRTWKNSLKLWSEYPLIGRGVPGGGVISDVQYTRVLREVGLLGFFAFLWIIMACFKSGGQSYVDENMDDLGQGVSIGYICGLTGLLVMGVGAEVFIIIRIMEPFWFLTAIIVALPELVQPETTLDTQLADYS